MATTTDLPEHALELRSTLTDDGVVTMAVHETAVRSPEAGEVVVRVEAAPINPSDLGMMFAMADLADASPASGPLPGVQLPVTPAAVAAMQARVGHPMPVGNEGAGIVVAAGSDDRAQALLGRTVGFVSGNSYSQFQTLAVESCLPMPEGTTPEQAAAPFVNPLTALGMVETMRLEGHTALVHTVGASNLGLMLNRVCAADGIGLVNIVRRPEQVERVRAEGGEHVVVSSADSFRDDLAEAIRATGATIAFDAIGGGDLASILLSTMEKVAAEGAGFSRYGSDTHKQVYVYGGLDRSPTTLRRDFGMSWGIGGWLLTPFLGRIGGEAAEVLRQRVADEITTTFASAYGHRLTLEEAVDPDQVRRYGKMATGDKALITPNGAA
ncbi:zinc-binding dehydrogenase [Actinospongicola halichondriae]|uniref:zinc-binding dehydrogenase n=1 Tax=Actinospongicola halichondriae TaxID=3236844 RepID=UPI003D5355F7